MMSDDLIGLRAQAFEKDLLSWTALHHFLSAPLLKELASATIARGLPNLGLHHLFDDAISTGPAALASWVVAPRPVEGKKETFYQTHIRSLLWSNDSEIWRHSDADAPPSLEDYIGYALRLGRMDFGASRRHLNQLQLPETDSVSILVSALQAGLGAADAEADGALEAMRASIQHLPSPLDAVALKHFGDLFADADRWMSASKLYVETRRLLTSVTEEWSAFGLALDDMAAQSEASALWVVQGAASAWRRHERLASDASPAARLLTINGRHDALMARIRGQPDRDWSDLRSAILSPPLLTHSFDVGRAVELALNGKGPQSAQYFWSTLRRHAALGSLAEVKATKSAYGRALVGGLAPSGSKIDRDSFVMGVRLLLEAGLEDDAAHIRFEKDTVRALVTLALVDDLAARARRYPGSETERAKVLVELSAKWVAELTGDQSELAVRLLKEIVYWAKERPAAFERSSNLGGRCLKILIDRAQDQPEFREAIADAVHAAVLSGLTETSVWTGKSDSLKLAFLYRDIWSEGQIRAVLDLMPYLLQPVSVGGMRFVTRAALDFLRTREVMAVVRAAPELGSAFFKEVLHFSLADRDDPVTTLFNLSAFAKEAGLGETDAEAVMQIVAVVSEQAATHNSSGATDAIRALLVAAAHTGPEGVRCAADNLIAILGSKSKGSSPSFAHAYDPLLDLIRSQDEVRTGAGLSRADFQAILDQIGDALVQAWLTIMEKPARLAPFSLPPSNEPSRVLINNYAVATVQFARIISNSSDLEAVLAKASNHPQLADIVHRVVVSGSHDPWDDQVAVTVAAETNDVFYELLGRRLAQARDAEPLVQEKALGVLLTEVIARGPHELDLALFAALPRSLEALPASASAYFKRLSARPSLLRRLSPLIPRVEADDDF